MQAIILAAGMGKRLGELTRNNTKCMVEVGGEKLIDRVLGQLVRLNLSRVVIVVGYKADNLISHIDNRYDGKLKIEYVTNPIFDKTNNIYSLALAKQKLQEDDTILLESDLIYEDRMLNLLTESDYPNLALVAKYEPWMDGTMVRIDKDNNILSFVPKKSFHYEETPYYYKTCNIYKFSRDFSINQYVPFLEAYSKAMGNNEYYEEVLRVITSFDKSALKALPITDEKWYEIDDIQDKEIAETLFAKDDTILKRYHQCYGGYWRFPQLKDFCYLVNPYFPTTGMKDEIKASFDALLTQYPSGMKVNSLLAAKYFGIRQEYVCVGNGAAELIKCLVENHCPGTTGFVMPTFEEYPNRSDDNVIYSPENKDFKYSADDLKTFFADKDISNIVIVNPDNPSGNCIAYDELIGLIEWAGQKGISIVVDESFVDFTDNHLHASLLNNDTLQKYLHLTVVKSISKSYGVPGLRLGVIASGNVEQMELMRKEVAIWNINSFAEFYMQIFGKYEKDYLKACDRFIEERNVFFKELSAIPFLRVIPSQANYFLCEVTERYTSQQLTKLLLTRYDILIKDCSGKAGFEGKNYVRIAIRDREDDSMLATFLDEINKEQI